MAPALTEPLSPAEKLSNRTSSSSPNTRSSKRLGSNTSHLLLKREKREKLSTTLVVNRRTRNNNRLPLKGSRAIQEKPSSTTSPIASPSQSQSQSSSSPATSPHISSSTSPPISTTTPELKTSFDICASESDEQMGVSNATDLSSSNINAENENLHSTSKQKLIDEHLDNSIDNNNTEDEEEAGESPQQHEPEGEEQQQTVSSTEQLLKDLTDNFEEAITAEICLRSQLVDTDLEKETKAAFKESKDIILIKPGKGGAPEVNSTLMESPTTTTKQTQDLNETTATTLTATAAATATATTTKDDEQILNAILDDIDDVSQVENQDDPSPNQNAEIVSSNTDEQSDTKAVPDDTTAINEGEQAKEVFIEPAQKPEKEAAAPSIRTEPLQTSDDFAEKAAPSVQLSDEKPIITSIEVLPRINTDSTMSASEIEDNIEERLMMLEGCTPSTTHADLQSLTSRSPSNQQSMIQVCDSHQQPQVVSQFDNTANFHTSMGGDGGMGGVAGGTQMPVAQANCNELEDQDIEEVLKALKGLDNHAAFDGDLNVLLNEVYTSLNCDEMAASAQTSVVESGSSVTTQNTAPSNASHISSITEIKASPLQESHSEICNTQAQLLKRLDNQMRRLRKLQVRHMCRHISEEIAGLIEWSARWSHKNLTGDKVNINDKSDENAIAADGAGPGAGAGAGALPFKFVLQSRPPLDTWLEERKTQVPMKQIHQFLKRLEYVALAQQQNATNLLLNTKNALNSSTTPLRKSRKVQQHQQENVATPGGPAASSPAPGTPNSTSSSSVTNKASSPIQPQAQPEVKLEEVVPTFDEDVTEELYQVSGLLHCQMHQMQKAYDSDATDSSSGAESADEAISYNNTTQYQRPIPQRATYRYSKDRGRIAARWSWLQSQSADTEIRIRQLMELAAEARRSKATAYVGVRSDAYYYKPQEFASKSVNGYKPRDYGSATDFEHDAVELPDCARTRVNITKHFRKRKLLQTANLHTISKKAARPSSIKCGCQWPLNPCALCTGRADPTAIRDPPDTMARGDRIALIDAGFHPVLSLQDEDVGTSLHFEAIASMSDWQIRVMRCQPKSIVKGVWKAEREAAAATGHGRRNGEPKRRYIRKKDKLAGERAAAADAVPLGPLTNPPRAVSSMLTNLNDRGIIESSGVGVGVGAGGAGGGGVGLGGKFEGGNGTGILSSSSSTTTTPLVANSKLLCSSESKENSKSIFSGVFNEFEHFHHQLQRQQQHKHQQPQQVE